MTTEKKKLQTVQAEGYVKTLCCERTGRLMVIYKRDGKTNNGGTYPAYFYCSNCNTACNGRSEIIGKYDPVQDEVIDPETGSIVPYERSW